MSQTFDEITAMLDRQTKAIEGVKSDVAFLKDQISKLSTSGLTAEELTELQKRVGGISDSLDALDAETTEEEPTV